MNMKVSLLVFFYSWSISIAQEQNATQAEDTPKSIVQKQVEAYNSHDLEAFLSCFSNSSEGYIFPDKLLGKGKEEQRKVFKEFFANAPQAHAKIFKSISLGNYIINHEVATGMPGDETIEAIVIYKVEKNLITKVWFIYK